MLGNVTLGGRFNTSFNTIFRQRVRDSFGSSFSLHQAAHVLRYWRGWVGKLRMNRWEESCDGRS